MTTRELYTLAYRLERTAKNDLEAWGNPKHEYYQSGWFYIRRLSKQIPEKIRWLAMDSIAHKVTGEPMSRLKTALRERALNGGNS